MCHIPVPAPRRAQDPPHELPGGVPGCYSLCRGNCQARPPRLLQGLRSRCHPAHSSHRPHLCLLGTTAQIFWDQSHHLRRRDRTLPHPGGVSVGVTTEIPNPVSAVWGQHRSATPIPAPVPCPCLWPASPTPLSSLFSGHLYYLWDFLEPLVPSCTVGLGVFFFSSLSPVPCALPGARLRRPGQDGGVCPSSSGAARRAGGGCFQAPMVPTLLGTAGLAASLFPQAAGLVQRGSGFSSCLLPWAAWHRCLPNPPLSSAQPKFPSTRRLLGSSGIVPHPNDDQRGARLAAAPLSPSARQAVPADPLPSRHPPIPASAGSVRPASLHHLIFPRAAPGLDGTRLLAPRWPHSPGLQAPAPLPCAPRGIKELEYL
ncbi:mitochondrial dicarboxylate carrier isoform X1 [Phaenicophaeus curvirostris]|uniref:mitochondrial dicarboxylate carrier isoform X1 n=1 Tax=Phaenicophaeus curvirostris TaxID=33595 RepID=UPI0037F0D7E4